MRRNRISTDTGRLDHDGGPSRERYSRIVVVKMDPDSRCRVEAACQRLGWGRAVERGDKEIEDALVLGDIGVALLHDVIAPCEVTVELAARSRRAGDDELSVPLVRQSHQD